MLGLLGIVGDCDRISATVAGTLLIEWGVRTR